MACVCVYGAASDRINKEYIVEVEQLGRLLAERGHSIVYGAGASGLMGAVARGMDAGGGKIIGVAPHFMHEFEPLYDCTEIIQTETMAQRKSVMEERAEAFIVVPGGVGTFDEFFQILTLKELGQLGRKPIILLNVDGYFEELHSLLKASDSKGFLRWGVMEMFSVCGSPEEAVAILEQQPEN